MTPSRRAAEVTRSKDGWLEGYPLLWCSEPFKFVRFDPAWPRAICKRPDESECAIDIRTATPVSSATHRKRAERLRRKEAGEVRIEVWIDEITGVRLDAFAKENSLTRSEAVEVLIWSSETVK